MADETNAQETTQEAENTQQEAVNGENVKEATAIMPDADADALRKEVRKLRDESAQYRTKSKDLSNNLEELNSFKQKIQGLFGEDEVDPETQVTELKSENARLKKQFSIYEACQKHNGDVELVTAILMNRELEDVEKAVAKAIKDNPKLQAESPKSVGDQHDSGGDSNVVSMNDLIRQAAGR